MIDVLLLGIAYTTSAIFATMSGIDEDASGTDLGRGECGFKIGDVDC